MSLHPTGAQWFVVQCKTGQDQRAYEHLARQGFVCYRPVRTIGTPRRGSTQARAQSLLPGYLFVRFDLLKDNWRSIRFTRGVSNVVCCGDEPMPIADDIVAGIQDRCAGLSDGSPFELAERSGTEIDAIVTSSTCEQRISHLLSLLQRR